MGTQGPPAHDIYHEYCMIFTTNMEFRKRMGTQGPPAHHIYSEYCMIFTANMELRKRMGTRVPAHDIYNEYCMIFTTNMEFSKGPLQGTQGNPRTRGAGAPGWRPRSCAATPGGRGAGFAKTEVLFDFPKANGGQAWKSAARATAVPEAKLVYPRGYANFCAATSGGRGAGVGPSRISFRAAPCCAEEPGIYTANIA